MRGGHAYHAWEPLAGDSSDVLHRCARCGIYRVSDCRSMTFFSPDQRDVLCRVRFNRGGVPRCKKVCR